MYLLFVTLLLVNQLTYGCDNESTQKYRPIEPVESEELWEVEFEALFNMSLNLSSLRHTQSNPCIKFGLRFIDNRFGLHLQLNMIENC